MNNINLNDRLVRYGELIPCKTAFIDTHTPGSNQKENFSIIGSGVSENPDQHVHITIPHGFNIGAAGQPPKCHNSLHSHRTAEVFFVLSGRWRFFWGRYGDAGDVILEKGDIFNIPTGIFRGFENIGKDYGMLMAILGGDDAGERRVSLFRTACGNAALPAQAGARRHCSQPCDDTPAVVGGPSRQQVLARAGVQ